MNTYMSLNDWPIELLVSPLPSCLAASYLDYHRKFNERCFKKTSLTIAVAVTKLSTIHLRFPPSPTPTTPLLPAPPKVQFCRLSHEE